MATMPSKRCIPTHERMRPASRSTAAGTNTPSPSRPANPPVNAFWSVTMYDGKSQFLVKNPINRYLINSPMLAAMKKDPDGSLTLYIQKDSPGADKEANWLPAPDDKIYLVMRLYWPKPEAALDPAGRRRDVEAAGCETGRVVGSRPSGR